MSLSLPEKVGTEEGSARAAPQREAPCCSGATRGSDDVQKGSARVPVQQPRIRAQQKACTVFSGSTMLSGCIVVVATIV